MGTLTMKFGGSTVGTTTALTQVVSILLQEYERWDRLIVIVSALEGVTDALLEATHLAQLGNRRGYRRIVATIRTRHMALIDQLPLGPTERNALQADIDQLLYEMLDTCEEMSDPTADNVAPDAVDAVIGVGERLSARIVAALVRQNGLRGVAIDATEIIITDANYGNATPNIDATRTRVQEHLLPMLERRIIPVITGFIAGTPSGKPTTLGRGGSDYTASILSICTDTTEVWMWADVDGMMSADPREIPDAAVIPELSYDEVAELAYFGARILHSRMIAPLRADGIPVRIKNVFKPQQAGTLIHNTASTEQNRVIKAVTSIQGIGLTANKSGSLADIAALVNDSLIRAIGSPADVMITGQSSSRSFICFVIPTSAGPDAVHTAQTFIQEQLATHTEVGPWNVLPVSIVTTIGAHIDRFPRLIGKVFGVLDDIPVMAISQGPSHCSLSIVVEPQNTESALHRIHSMTTNNDADTGQAPSA